MTTTMSLQPLGGIDPEKPYQATFESKVGENRTRRVTFKKLAIANPFHQYSNSFKKHSDREKFSLGAFPVGIAYWPSTHLFRASNCIILKVVALM